MHYGKIKQVTEEYLFSPSMMEKKYSAIFSRFPMV